MGSGQVVGDDERSFVIEYDDSRKRYEYQVSKEKKSENDDVCIRITKPASV